MGQYQILLFDADGTIFDFDLCEKEALSQTFKKYNYPLDDEIMKKYEHINHSLWKQYELGQIDRNAVIYTRFGALFREIGIEDDGIAFEDDYQETLGMQHFFIKDAAEVLQNLYRKYELYIVTNGVTKTQYRRIQESKVDQYVKKIFVSEETGYQKPMVEYFDYCFARIENFDASKTMIIGDTLSSDIKGGNNAGITTCWFNPQKLNNTTDAIVDIEIHSLKQLYDILCFF